MATHQDASLLLAKYEASMAANARTQPGSLFRETSMDETESVRDVLVSVIWHGLESINAPSR